MPPSVRPALADPWTPLLPASAQAPIKHDSPMYIGYTGYSNLTDWAAAVFPVTKVLPEVDVKEDAWEFRGDQEKMVYETCGSPSV